MPWQPLFSAEAHKRADDILDQNFDQDLSLYADQVTVDILDGKETFPVVITRRWEVPSFGFESACPCGASRCPHAAAALKLADVVLPTFTDALAQPIGVAGETGFEIVEIPGPYPRVGLKPVLVTDGKTGPVAFQDLPIALQKQFPEQPADSEAKVWAIDREGDDSFLHWLLGLKRFNLYFEGQRMRVTDNERNLKMVPTENSLAKFHQPIVDGFAKIFGPYATYWFDHTTWEIGVAVRPGYPPFWLALLHGNDFVKDIAEHEALLRGLYPAEWVDFAFPRSEKAAA